MKRSSLLLMILAGWLLSACGGGIPKMLWGLDEGKGPSYAQDQAGGAQSQRRLPLDIPPELRKDIEVPMPDQVAPAPVTTHSSVTKDRKQAVAGTAVSLDARRYDYTPGQVFSASIDAMTALNLPVGSVDSPSGTVTTEWMSQNINSPNATVLTSALNMFGVGSPSRVRYRYVVRVLRTASRQSQLEIRTLGQQFVNNHWSNAPLKKKVADELFAAVEEQLARLKKPIISPVDSL